MDQLTAQEAVKAFQRAEAALGAVVDDAAAISDRATELREANASVSELAVSLRDTSEQWNEVAAGIAGATTQISEAAELLKRAEPEALTEEVRLLAERLDSLEAGFQSLNKRADAIVENSVNFRDAVTSRLEAVNKDLNSLDEDLSDTQVALQELRKNLDDRHEQTARTLGDLGSSVRTVMWVVIGVGVIATASLVLALVG